MILSVTLAITAAITSLVGAESEAGGRVGITGNCGTKTIAFLHHNYHSK
jgi:hypothetical protein